MQEPAPPSRNDSDGTVSAERKDDTYVVISGVVNPNCSQNEHGQDNEKATSEMHRIEADEKWAYEGVKARGESPRDLRGKEPLPGSSPHYLTTHLHEPPGAFSGSQGTTNGVSGTYS